MALIPLPAGAIFTRRAWTTPARNQVNRSAWTGARTVLRLPGAGYWKVSASVLPMAREVEVRPWRGFFAAVEGSANTFYMPAACDQIGAGGNPRAHTPGAGAGDGVLPMRGLDGAGTPGAGVKLVAGQYMTVSLPSGKKQMVILTRDLVSNEAGNGVATFRGALREPVADNAPVEIFNPVCEMALVGAPAWEESDGVYRFALDAEEVF